MLCCQGAQNIGLSNHKLKSALTREFFYATCKTLRLSVFSQELLTNLLTLTVWSQCTPVSDRRTGRQTDKHHGKRIAR